MAKRLNDKIQKALGASRKRAYPRAQQFLQQRVGILSKNYLVGGSVPQHEARRLENIYPAGTMRITVKPNIDSYELVFAKKIEIPKNHFFCVRNEPARTYSRYADFPFIGDVKT